MRLIDTDELLKKINSDENKRADALMHEWYADMVSRQPTVYNIDKTIEQLKDKKD